MKKIILLGIVLVAIILSGIISQQGVNALLTPIQLLSPMNTYVRSAPLTPFPPIPGQSEFGLAKVFCDSGDIVLGGGFNMILGHADFHKNAPIDSNGDIITDENTPAAGWLVQNSEQSINARAYVNCAKVPTLSVGGLQLETDTTALLLGYTILNSYWIAPTAVGIGLGIYLVKRKF